MFANELLQIRNFIIIIMVAYKNTNKKDFSNIVKFLRNFTKKKHALLLNSKVNKNEVVWYWDFNFTAIISWLKLSIINYSHIFKFTFNFKQFFEVLYYGLYFDHVNQKLSFWCLLILTCFFYNNFNLPYKSDKLLFYINILA